jgi:hypothetical protein
MIHPEPYANYLARGGEMCAESVWPLASGLIWYGGGSGELIVGLSIIHLKYLPARLHRYSTTSSPPGVRSTSAGRLHGGARVGIDLPAR